MGKFSSEIVVRYAETDQMGVAHHSCYLVWFEVARTEFFAKKRTKCAKIRGTRVFFTCS